MVPISSSGSATALLVLQQTNALSAKGSRAAGPQVGGAGLLQPGEGTGRLSIDAQGRITESLFSVTAVDANKLKVNLMERLGKELGLDLDDFESASAFGKAVKQAINAIKMEEGAAARLAEIERNLELDELGVTLDELVEAIEDPDSDASKKLEAALLKHAGGEAHGSAAARLYDL